MNRHNAWGKLKASLNCIFIAFLVACSTTSDPKPKLVPRVNYPQKINIVWVNNDLGRSSPSSFVPVVDSNAIFTADSLGNIFKIDQADGSIINHYSYPREFSSGTAVTSNSIFVTTIDGYLLSIDKAHGEIAWQAQLPSLSVEAPQVGGDVVVVRTNDSQILAYSIINGSLLWVYQKATPPLTLRTYNTFQVVGQDVILIGQPSGRVALVNLNTGIAIWETYIAVPEGATDLDKLIDLSVRPVINDKEICVATFNGKLACLDAISSNILWSKKFSTSYGLLIDDRNVYAISQDGVIYAYDKNSGGDIWKNDILQYRSLSPPVFLNNDLLIIDKDGFISLFNRNNGELVGYTDSNLINGISFPWADGKKVIVQSGNGNIAEIMQ